MSTADKHDPMLIAWRESTTFADDLGDWAANDDETLERFEGSTAGLRSFDRFADEFITAEFDLDPTPARGLARPAAS